MLVSIWILINQKFKENLSGSEEKNFSFPDNLREELDEKFSITQNDCQHTGFYPCGNSVTATFKQLCRDVYEKCCSSNEKNILIKGEYNKWYST